MQTKITLREARKQISTILASGQTVTIARPYEDIRGFIVGVPAHDRWSATARRKALAQAKASFHAAWKAAANQCNNRFQR